ncbi:hypothetical protein ACUXAV_000658 [Cupriavidus metallidurans]|jgi:hypothetical protein|uniref:hypothetical protein n=1 Tax=Cupriavidus TaxID=106589 RepID=UPI0004B0D127|nr:MULTISPECIES: hypothetical protein [Cupriavidus]MDE4918559.1 hypothetical protein [Cupriavidus metallidurans]
MAKLKDEQSALPSSILLDESIGWMENGILRQFHEGQHVTNRADIAALIQHGAQYLELK